MKYEDFIEDFIYELQELLDSGNTMLSTESLLKILIKIKRNINENY